MIAAIRLVRSVLGDEAGLKKTQTEVLGLAKFTFCFCFVLVCFFFVFFCFELHAGAAIARFRRVERHGAQGG